VAGLFANGKLESLVFAILYSTGNKGDKKPKADDGLYWLWL
jgi:hypothetical protein